MQYVEILCMNADECQITIDKGNDVYINCYQSKICNITIYDTISTTPQLKNFGINCNDDRTTPETKCYIKAKHVK